MASRPRGGPTVKSKTLVSALVLLLVVIATPWALAQTFTTLFDFDYTDGDVPSGLVQATNGNLYGTTGAGGANTYGTVFKITPEGSFTTLHTFDGADGAHTASGLVQDTNGNLYGTASHGGLYSDGTVF